MKQAKDTTLTDYNEDFIMAINRLDSMSRKGNDSETQLKLCLDTHIPKMALLIQAEYQAKGNVPRLLLKAFDWACYKAISAYGGPEKEDIDKQYQYVQMSIDYAFTVKSDYFVAEAFTNKLYLCLDRRDPWGLRDTVVALKEANARLSIVDQNKFETHIIRCIKDKLYEQEKEEAALMDSLDNLAFPGSQSKPRLTQFEIEQQRALNQNLFSRMSSASNPERAADGDNLEELLNLFARKCGLN